jgi:hypothetical protein
MMATKVTVWIALERPRNTPRLTKKSGGNIFDGVPIFSTELILGVFNPTKKYLG